MARKTISFWQFIGKHRAEIPIIQRDYAQGRLGQEYLRESFLNSLNSSLSDNLSVLKLDFVYGSECNGKFQPLDGQQRLTTLWLLHWYIALRAGRLAEACTKLNQFTYETRISSREFCKELCDENNFKGYNDKSSIVDFITSRTWFFSRWKQDPTIQSMLRMLGGTKRNDERGNDIIDGLEELFERTDSETFGKYWDALTSDNPPIVFYYLPLEEFGLTDDLYIKMNARGKQLTSFENFKADLVGYIKERARTDETWKALGDPATGIPGHMDTTWTDVFWKHRNAEDDRIDEIFFAFINRYILNCGIAYANVNKESKSWKLYGDESDDSCLSYDSGFELYSDILSDTKDGDGRPILTLANMDKLFANLTKSGYVNINQYLPEWYDRNETFHFIPEYTEDEITALTQSQRVVFFGICRYFETCTFDEAMFSRWMRVVCNLAEGTEGIDTMIARIKLIEELSRHAECIYEFLADKDAVIKSDAAKDQLQEEIEKAKQICHPQDTELPEKPTDWDKGKEWNWETAITEAESHAFFNGAIGFLFRNGEGKWDWHDYASKWKNVQTFFGEDGYYKQDAILLRYFISKFTEWKMFWDGITYDNTPSSWRYVLLKSNWINPIHELLISIRIEIDTDYHSSLNENQNRKKVQEVLVTTTLLDHIASGCTLKPLNTENGVKYMLLRPRSWYDKYVVADKRNTILSSLYGGKEDISAADKQPGKIYSNQRLDECDFFWGEGIEFEYKCTSDGELYVFKWQPWDWIDLYVDGKRLCNEDRYAELTVDGRKLANKEELVERMNQCISRYKDSRKHD